MNLSLIVFFFLILAVCLRRLRGTVDAGAAMASSSTGDDKAVWYAWAHDVEARLASKLVDYEKLSAVAKANSGSAWITKAVMKSLEASIKMKQKALQKLRTAAAVHTMTAPVMFGNKRFKDIKTDVDNVMACDDKDVQVLKNVFIQQGLLA